MGLFLSFRDSTVLCLPDWEPGGPCRGRVSPLKFPPTSTFAWGLFLRKAAVGGGRFGSGTGTPPETPALPRSRSWREGGDPSLRRPELPPGFPYGKGDGRRGTASGVSVGSAVWNPLPQGRAGSGFPGREPGLPEAQTARQAGSADGGSLGQRGGSVPGSECPPPRGKQALG